MRSKTVVRLLPMCLGLFGGAARADLEPFSFGATETLQHQTNVNRDLDAKARSDWLSTTELKAALDQAIGRQRLTASLGVDFNHYRHQTTPDNTGYSAVVGLAWSTVGDLSGTLGADSKRHQYTYGSDGGFKTDSVGRNLETDNHVGTTVQLGGSGRWVIFTGADASERNYSNSALASSEERQWSGNLGTRYQTSPDLSFGLTGSYTHGRYTYVPGDSYSVSSVDATTRWQAGGSTALDARAGYTVQAKPGAADQRFLNGSLNWSWTPPSRLSTTFGLARDVNADTSGTDNGTSSLVGRSVNNAAHASVRYELSSKISLVANGEYVRRRYTHQGTADLSGSNRTSIVGLSAHYTPTRTTDLNCGFSREVRKTDASLVSLTPGYTDNIAQCSAAIQFK